MRGLVSLGCANLAMAACAAFAAPAGAEPAVGLINGTNLLVTFDTATPGTFTSQKHVTGLGVGERLVGVDYRLHPNNEIVPLPPSQLFAVAVVDGASTDTARVYTIDPASAAATLVGGPITVSDGDSYGMDFNPTVDRIRLVNDKDANVRLNPNNGSLTATDTPLSPAGEKVSGIAYDRIDIQIPPIVPANSTAYAIATASSSLVTIGGINQAPSPNGGALSNAKPLGLTVAPGSSTGLEIAVSGTTFASLVDGNTGQPGLYTIDLGSGAATLIGSLPETLSGFAIVPGSAPTPVQQPDLTPPSLVLKGVPKSLSLASFLKGVSVKATPSEPGKLDGVLLAAAKSARLASFNLTLASKSLKLAAGQRTLKLKPSKRLVGQPGKTFRVRLQVTATDAAGNAKIVTKTIKVKPSSRNHHK